jgi:phosphate transport system permease protein
MAGALRKLQHAPLTSKRRGVVGERIFIWVGRFAVFAPLAVLGWLLAQIIVQGIARIDWAFLTNIMSMRPNKAGIYPPLMGSLYLMVLTPMFALPIGVGAAIYLEEYGRKSRIAGAVEVAIANLAGVPSIIYGMLGLGLFVRFAAFGESIIAGAMTLALLILPIVIMSTREALRTVRDSLREAALALGASRWRMIWHVVLPMSIPGILTGSILAMSRAIGEAAPLVLVGAATFITFAPDGIDSLYSAMPMTIFHWSTEPRKDFHIAAAAAIIVLMVVLLVLNSLAIWLRNRYQKRSY